jgi:hypothetical protein
MHCGGTALDKGAVVKTIERFRQEIEVRGVFAQEILKKASFSSFQI